MKLKRLTALILALALALSLTAVGFAAEAEESPTEPVPVAAAEDNSAPVDESAPADEEEAPATKEETPAADESAPVDEEEAPGTEEEPPAAAADESAPADEEETSDTEEEAPTSQADPEMALSTREETPAAIIWFVAEGQDYVGQPEYEYDGQEHRPDCKLLRDGGEVPRSETWTEAWFTDAECTQPTTDLIEPGERWLRLMDGDTVKAQGGFRIVKAAQRITVKTANTAQLYKKDGTFSLEAKSSGDGALTYSSSDPGVVSVNEEGLCAMQKPGVVTITVRAAETEHYKAAKGKVEVTVYIRPKKLSYSRSYMHGKYYQTLKKLKLTGTTGQNAVDIALSQLGYKEGRKSGQLAGNGRGLGNWTEYGRYYGLNHQPWCAIFVNWCAREAGASYSVVPKYAACRYYHSYFKGQGRFHSWKSVRSGSYKPQKGDIILYAYTKGGVAHHIGFVLDVSYGGGKVKVTTVEGNTNDRVRRVSVSYSRKGSGKHGGHYILGMANPKW